MELGKSSLTREPNTGADFGIGENRIFFACQSGHGPQKRKWSILFPEIPHVIDPCYDRSKFNTGNLIAFLYEW